MRIVVKVGTSTLTQGGKKLSQKYMLELTGQLSSLQAIGHEVILVSSGAMAAGRELLGITPVDQSLPLKQMFAAIGQVELMRTWSKLFLLHEIHVGQILLTKEDLSDAKRCQNAKDTLSCLFQHRAVPIINENDSVATEEIRVGDNDNLAALVGNLMGADLLILLTDQQGLYTADPRLDPAATLIPLVECIDDSIFALAKGPSTSCGTGGMITKIEAAKIATDSGTLTIIASSAIPNVLIDICNGKKIGTSFLPKTRGGLTCK